MSESSRLALPRWPTLARAGGCIAAGALLCLWALSEAPGGTGAAPAAARAGKPPQLVTLRLESRPRWAELSTTQQRALKPLMSSWDSLSEGQRRKWLALSRNYAELSEAEQQTLHERMSEWAALSATERNVARLNFAVTKKLSPDEKQAKWEAYQALSDEQRRVLARQAPRAPAGAAPAVRPVPAQRLANLPPRTDNRRHVPRIATAPHQVDPNTLLPQVDDPDTGFSVTADH